MTLYIFSYCCILAGSFYTSSCGPCVRKGPGVRTCSSTPFSQTIQTSNTIVDIPCIEDIPLTSLQITTFSCVIVKSPLRALNPSFSPPRPDINTRSRCRVTTVRIAWRVSFFLRLRLSSPFRFLSSPFTSTTLPHGSRILSLSRSRHYLQR